MRLSEALSQESTHGSEHWEAVDAPLRGNESFAYAHHKRLVEEELCSYRERHPELPERERRVIELRYGLDGSQPCTLEEVGQAFGVTRERIRQIESKTLSKLRHPSRSQKLRDYLE